MADAEPKKKTRSPNRHLPLLTWLLLVAVGAFFLKTYLSRPTDADKLGTASVQRAAAVIRDNYYKEADDAELYRNAVQGMVRGLDDRFSVYLRPSEYRNAEFETKGGSRPGPALSRVRGDRVGLAGF